MVRPCELDVCALPCQDHRTPIIVGRSFDRCLYDEFQVNSLRQQQPKQRTFIPVRVRLVH